MYSHLLRGNKGLQLQERITTEPPSLFAKPVQTGELIAEFVAQEELQCGLVATRKTPACIAWL